MVVVFKSRSSKVHKCITTSFQAHPVIHVVQRTDRAKLKYN